MLVARDESAQVVGIEPHGAAQVNSGKLAALDQALDCPWMDAQELGDLVGRQEGSGSAVEGGDRRSAVVAGRGTLSAGVVACRLLSPRWTGRAERLVLRLLVDLEEGELLCVYSHRRVRNLSVTRGSVNTR
jgi:hypothetical protein